MFRFSLIIIVLCVLCACASVHTKRYIPVNIPTPVKRNLGVPPEAACNSWKNYLPDPKHPEWMPPRSVRVNFHVMNSRDSSHNFKPDEARAYLRALQNYANIELDTNVRNWRSPDGTEVLPKGYRYVIAPQPVPGDDGFYFHYDDNLYYFISQGRNTNNYDRKVVDKYNVGKDSIINIFLMVHPDDSIKSKTYRANGQGIALGTAFKMAGLYESKESALSFDGLFNHELGHVFGLSHAWMEDGCPDTDNHPNKCWVYTEDGPCRHQATDNMMDYNAYQIALTPCQIGKIQANLANESYYVRKCLAPDWCTRNPDFDITVTDSVAVKGARDLKGSITIENGGALYLSCRVSMPEGSRILVKPGGHLWLDGCRLHNSCGKDWQGILVQKKGDLSGAVHELRPAVLENCPKKGK